MRRFVLVISIIALQAVPTAGLTDTVVIRDVTVIDGSGAGPKSGMTVVVSDGRIAAIGSAARTRSPLGAVEVDGRGKYLIPGLWDMHVHMTTTPGFTDLFLANGVTGVRDMFSYPEDIHPLREDIRSGKRAGPRIISAGRIVDGPKPIWPRSVAVKDEEEGRKAVLTVKSEGSDFVKVYSLLPRDAYFAIVKESARLGLPVVGHVPDSVTIREASDAGQRCIEHLTGVLAGCAPRVKRPDPGGGTPELARRWAYLTEIMDSYDEKSAADLFRLFKKNGTWHCPTLTVSRNIAGLNDSPISSEPRAKYVSSEIRSYWDPKNDFRFKNYRPETWTLWKRSYRMQKEIVGKMYRAGVQILAGTDVGNPYCLPGFSLHDELALLVECGLSPMAALQTATRNPARFLGLEKECGTITRGKRADLVLLDANPLEDIRNTSRVRAVLVGGKLMERAAINEILRKAEEANRETPADSAKEKGP
jgi:imidazolonepropionase-like amidohydrolase